MTPEDFNDWEKLIQPLTTQLTRIADLLTWLATPQEPTSEPELPCPHPEESRIDFGMTNGQPDWQCGICQYRSVPPL